MAVNNWNTLVGQMKQWPPTGTTIMGVCFIAFAVDYYFRGNFAEAMTVAGILSYIIPEDKGYVEKAEEILDILTKIEK